jgi:hypothetical protein
MSEVAVLGTGVRVDEYLGPESLARGMSLVDRGDLERWRAGESLFVRLTWFVEFDDDSGRNQRWEGTPQGPYAVPVGSSATSALLGLIDDHGRDFLGDLRGDFGIGGIKVSRFAFEAAPRRIDVDSGLARRLTLD